MARASTNFQDPPPVVPLLLLLPSGEQIPVEGTLHIGTAEENDVVLSDGCVSRDHCVLEVDGDGRTIVRDLDSTNGTWVNGARVTEAELPPGARLAVGAKRLRLVAATEGQSPILGQAPAVDELRKMIRAIAPLPATVLVIGETGVGKELVAQQLHAQSGRSGAYVAINCATITATLAESILFGHERGAFTGATTRQPGVFEQANRGTLFLDEIGEMEIGLQSRLLRVLENGTLRPIGASAEITVDVRVVAATNRDLGAAVQARRFREDLFYRLHQHQLTVPPLRDRQSDIVLLAKAFLAEIDPVASFTDAALARLVEHPWPGNVRELRNCVTRAALLGQSPIEAWDIAFDETHDKPPRGTSPEVTTGGRKLAEIERDAIEAALRQCHGNINRAAALLGIPKSTLYDRVRRYGIVVKK
jgi:DNA-binding NtrC family response regulator